MVTWHEHYGTFDGMAKGTLVAEVNWFDEATWEKGDDGLHRVVATRKYWVAFIVGQPDPGGGPMGLSFGLDHREWGEPEPAMRAAEEWLATHPRRPSRRGTGGRTRRR